MADDDHDADLQADPELARVESEGDDRGSLVPETVREFVGTGVFWVTLLILVLAAVVVAIVVQNTHDVRFEFLWLDARTPLLTVILLTALVAAVSTAVVTALWRSRRRRVLQEREELRRLRGEPAGRGGRSRR